MVLIYVSLGGGLGACLRWGISRWAAMALPSFPYGVLICNLLGSFLIGFLVGVFQKPSLLQVGLITGLLGGFTTFSSFSLDTFKLFQAGDILLAVTNVFTSVILGLVCVWLGVLASQVFNTQ